MAGGPDTSPLENHKNIGFLAILLRIPWKMTKLPSQLSLSGYHRPASETTLKWRFAGGPLDPLHSPHQLKNYINKFSFLKEGLPS